MIFEHSGKREEGIYGRHFIPRRGEEPKGLEPSGALVPYIAGEVSRNSAGQFITGTGQCSHYDYNGENIQEMFILIEELQIWKRQ